MARDKLIKFRRGTSAEFDASVSPVAKGEAVFIEGVGLRVFREDGICNTARYDEYRKRQADYKTPSSMAKLVTVQSATDANTTVSCIDTTSGYFAVRWWDGTVDIASAGSGASKAIPASGAWSGPSPKEIWVWPCLGAADPTLSGELLAVKGSYVVEASVPYGCLPQFEKFRGTSLHLKALPDDYSGVPDGVTVGNADHLTDLTFEPGFHSELAKLSGALIEELDLRLVTLAESLNGNYILSVSNCPNLKRIFGPGLHPTSPTPFNFSITNNPLLESVILQPIDFNEQCLLRDNASLTEIRAVGVSFNYNGGFYSPHHYSASSFNNNNLSADAINQFYTDLANGTGILNMGGNPGTATADHSIATAKGYSVYTGSWPMITP